MPMSLPAPKQRALANALSELADRGNSKTLKSSDLAPIAKRHQVTLPNLTEFAERTGYFVAQTHSAQGRDGRADVARKTSEAMKLRLLTAQGHKTLLTRTDGKVDDATLCLISYGELRRERAALLRWLREEGVKLPHGFNEGDET